MKRFTSPTVLIACLLLFTLLVPMFSGCGATTPRTQVYYTYFDTVCTLYGYGTDADTFASYAAAAEDLLSEYHRLLDIYHAYDGVTNLYTLNTAAAAAPVSVGAELMAFLLCAKDMYDITDGHTNIALGAPIALWHDRRQAAAEGEDARLPDAEALAEAGRHTHMDDLILDTECNTVFFADEKLQLDGGAIAKGYVAERLAERLTEMGASACAVDLGGNLRVIGEKSPGTPFTAAIRDPFDTSATVGTVRLTEGSCVTSGAYERYMTVDGVRYAHILDPDTLYPPTHFESVTVLTEDGALADALSTALYIMSYEEGAALLQRLGGVRAVWITADGTMLTCGDI